MCFFRACALYKKLCVARFTVRNDTLYIHIETSREHRSFLVIRCINYWCKGGIASYTAITCNCFKVNYLIKDNQIEGLLLSAKV